MSAKAMLLLLVSMLIAFYLEIAWLVTLLAIVLFFLAIASIKREKPRTIAVPKAAESDIIYPVIYEDTGEAPYLYPKKMKVKVIPNWYGGESMWTNALYGVGNIFKSSIGWLTGGKKEKKK